MKILHTSDWHLGRTLYDKKRYEEFEAFLDWLAETIESQDIVALIVAGDIFDTSTPSNRAQQLYYRFLCRVAASSCRHVVIVAGNHDSPSFLSAPKELLMSLNVQVIGHISEAPEDDVLILRNEQGGPELIVCAVPYLRDKDIRVSEAGESFEDKERKLVDGIRNHYAAVAAHAEQKRAELGVEIPIVATGHLFTAGGQTIDGDGVRDLYIGSLAHVTAGLFPTCFNYFALGHLHVPQAVSGSETIRYSGSPLPMGFGEARQQKSVCMVTFHQTKASVQLIDVPVFRKLERIKGDLENISRRLLELSSAQIETWLEIIYDGQEVIGNLREQLEAVIANTQVEIINVKNNPVIHRILGQIHAEETLENLDEKEVFERCLVTYEVPDAQRPGLHLAYQEILSSLNEDDLHRE